ncbi:TlpA disulfide reductase family protein [Aristaeella lactis]|uniref:Thiol-disulfide isomerase or thioredoxin n=1 Tax=Aristaeella lactis TaxID=3046383 RepID=A0AC61PP72_9FIRM|nr:TlpA disulfide reductase family protein [Aristaeella lactis]QUA53240.1 TlpA family protein disulfide reductase [Aristaeella lactis]SMC81315.1 Thiol-disulfide isomerase or thioredoxin [Aristaeella lactis]
MKFCKAIRVFMSFLLIAVIAVSPACTLSETPWETMRFPLTGVEIDFPPASELFGSLELTSDIDLAPGVRFVEVYYIGAPKEMGLSLYRPDRAYTEEENQLLHSTCVSLLQIVCMDNGKTINHMPSDHRDFLNLKNFRELGSYEDHNFYICWLPDGYESAGMLSAEAKEEIESLVQSCMEPDRIRVFKPGEVSSVPIEFETTDLDGNPVQSGELFGKNTLTMVNVWTTWCGACLYELPSLQSLSERVSKKNVAVVGIVMDIQNPEDSETISNAKQLIADAGVQYMNLIPWDGILDVLPTYAYPTTYFIDSSGQLVGEPVTSAMSSYAYESIIKERLAVLVQGN